MLDDLYSSKLLELSASIPHIGRLERPMGSSTRHARLCGSVVSVDVILDDEGKIAHFAQDVKACALGQASASVLGHAVIGQSYDDLVAVRDALRALIQGEDVAFAEPFKVLDLFVAVRDYKARHASVMLAFEAVVEAMDAARAQAQTRKSEHTSSAA